MNSSFRRIFSVATLAVLLLAPLAARADDEEVDEQIEELTAQLRAQPENAELYLERGELYRQVENWDAALADYERALKIDPALHVIDFARGRLYLETGRAPQAKTALDRFLEKYPNHAEARMMRARALMQMRQGVAAIADYDVAITQSAPPSPDLYHERAKAIADLGPKRTLDAIASLDEGIARLGAIVSLQMHAIELEVSSRRFDQAVARLETISSHSARKEYFLLQKGEILQKAGRHNDAKAAWREALTHIDALPARARGHWKTRELSKKLQALLAQ
jgi:tetratricopeptide (TPR) repeat protein